jgi:hypothetical protein
MASFMDQMRKMEIDAKIRSKSAVKEDSPNCINCSYLGRDGVRTEKCVMCGMSTTKKFTAKKDESK